MGPLQRSRGGEEPDHHAQGQAEAAAAKGGDPPRLLADSGGEEQGALLKGVEQRPQAKSHRRRGAAGRAGPENCCLEVEGRRRPLQGPSVVMCVVCFFLSALRATGLALLHHRAERTSKSGVGEFA